MTFLAHQAPALAIKHRWPDRFDGVGLVVGTVLADVWYITSGWLYGPFGIPLWVDGHQLSAFGNTTIIPGIVVTMLIRRFVLAERGPRWWVSAWSVALGGLTHLVLDALSGARLGPVPIGQLVLSVPLVAATVWMLRRWWPDVASRVVRPTRAGLVVMIVGALLSLMWATTRVSDGYMPLLFTAVDGVAISMLVGFIITSLQRRPPANSRHRR